MRASYLRVERSRDSNGRANGQLVFGFGDAIGVNSMALELAIIMIGAFFLGLGFHWKTSSKSHYRGIRLGSMGLYLSTI